MSANACDVLSDSGEISAFITELNDLKGKTEELANDLERLYRTLLSDDSWKENGKNDLLKALGMVTQYGHYLSDEGKFVSPNDSSWNCYGSNYEVDGHFTRCIKSLESFESNINSLDNHTADCMQEINSI